MGIEFRNGSKNVETLTLTLATLPSHPLPVLLFLSRKSIRSQEFLASQRRRSKLCDPAKVIFLLDLLLVFLHLSVFSLSPIFVPFNFYNLVSFLFDLRVSLPNPVLCNKSSYGRFARRHPPSSLFYPLYVMNVRVFVCLQF